MLIHLLTSLRATSFKPTWRFHNVLTMATVKMHLVIIDNIFCNIIIRIFLNMNSCNIPKCTLYACPLAHKHLKTLLNQIWLHYIVVVMICRVICFILLYLIVSSMCAIIIGCMCGTYYFGITDCMYFICAGWCWCLLLDGLIHYTRLCVSFN